MTARLPFRIAWALTMAWLSGADWARGHALWASMDCLAALVVLAGPSPNEYAA